MYCKDNKNNRPQTRINSEFLFKNTKFKYTIILFNKMRTNNKRTFPAGLRIALEKATKENWQRESGSAFTEEQIIRVSGGKVVIDDYGDGKENSHSFKDLNRNELETVANWILRGTKFRRRN